MENIERIEKLLAFILLSQANSKSQKEKALLLNKVGFNNLEIADILGVGSSQVIANYLYSNKKKPAKK